jgi:hypothetical protein
LLPGIRERILRKVSDKPACWSWRLPTEKQAERIRRRWSTPTYDAGANREDFRWLLMIEWHDGRCAICGQNTGRRLRRDHEHDSGIFRGLLCPGCNTREGLCQESPYADYRLRNPAVIFNVKIRYAPPVLGVPLLVSWHLLPDREAA